MGTMHEIFNYTLDAYNSTSVRLHHQYINTTGNGSTTYKGADLYLSAPTNSSTQIAVTPGNNGSYSPPTIDIMVPSGGGSLLVRVLTNETSLTGLDTESLFLAQGNTSANDTGLQTALNGLSDGSDIVADQASRSKISKSLR